MVTEKPGVRQAPAGVEVARQAFLYGQGDGIPVVNVKRLAEIGDVTEATINRWMPGWLKQREEILVSSGSSDFGLVLSGETLTQHRKNTEFLKEQHDSLAAELKLIPKLHEFLEKVLDAFVSAPEKDYDQALKLFNAYHRNAGNARSIQSQFIAVQRAWKENAGIDSLQAVAEAREKTLATGRAKLDVKREEGAGNPGIPHAASIRRTDGVFDVDEVDPLEECG